MCRHFHDRKPWMIIPMILTGIVFAVMMAFLFGYFAMLLWNWLMPEIFGFKVITYWQAWGLVLLSHLLFKFNPMQHGHKHFHRNHHFNKEEFKEKFKERFKEKFHDE